MARIAAFLGASVLVIGSVVACSSSDSSSGGGGGSFSCDSKSKCSADQAGDKTACENELKGTCATEYKAFNQCALDKQTCTSDNKTDAAKLLSDCKSQFDAYSKCKQGGSGDGGK